MSEYIITNKQLDRFGIPAELFTEQEIVRCMDCKWFTNSSHYGAYCMNFVAPLHDDYDGFCAWGERKVDA